MLIVLAAVALWTYLAVRLARRKHRGTWRWGIAAFLVGAPVVVLLALTSNLDGSDPWYSRRK